MLTEILKNQAGSRILIDFIIRTPGECFSQKLSSHFFNYSEVDTKLNQLYQENPNAMINVIRR